MLFRIEDINGFNPIERYYNNAFSDAIRVNAKNVDYHIADMIRKEINGSKDRTLLSYSKSLATCLLKYNPYSDNELHLFNDKGFINSIIYSCEDNNQYSIKWKPYYLMDRVYHGKGIIKDEIFKYEEEINLYSFIVDVSDNFLTDEYLKMYTGAGKKKLASPEKDNEVVVLNPMNDCIISEYISAVYVLYGLQYKYGFLRDDYAYEKLVNEIYNLPEYRFNGCDYDERTAFINIIHYLKYEWENECFISRDIYKYFNDKKNISFCYDSLSEFYSIMNNSFEEAYYCSDYNDNVISNLCWTVCYQYITNRFGITCVF